MSKDRPAATPHHSCRSDPIRGRPAFSPDGHYVATAANGSAARLWDLTSPNPCSAPRLLGPHQDAVAEVAFSADSRWAATTSFDHKGRLWDIESGAEPKLVAELQFDDRVMETAFSPDNRWLAFGSWDRTAKVLDLKNPDTAKPITWPAMQAGSSRWRSPQMDAGWPPGPRIRPFAFGIRRIRAQRR